MPRSYVLRLQAEQLEALRQARDHARQPYVREHAAVVLAVAHGASLRQAARSAGLKPHRVEQASFWVHRVEEAGVAGLQVKKGRGRKPASFPARRRGDHGGGGGAA